nr:contractile injection system tape measure protein [uncultured Dyadobacter sp.]
MIQHLRIEAVVSDRSSVPAIQDDLGRWCRSEAFWQRLSDRLDELVPEGVVLHLPKIEMEIRAIDREHFLAELFEQLINEVTRALGEQTPVTAEAHWRRVALFFLARGYLPAGTGYADAPRVQLFLENLAMIPDPVFQSMLLDELPGKPQMIIRLQQFVGEDIIRRILLIQLLGRQDIEVPLEYIRRFFEINHEISQANGITLQKLESLVWTYLVTHRLRDVFADQEVLNNTLKHLIEAPVTERRHREGGDESTSQDHQTLFYVRNAGIVVLAPFFPQLFRALEWVENDQWKNERALSLAVRLIGHICSGTEKDREYNWVLAKILCGVSPETVIDMEFPLPKEAIALSVQMMEAVIEQWKVLKSTTPDGLRELFIHREGKLSADEEGTGWRLRVEKKSQDVLLERLPWGISVIRLPWMETMLLVEW